MNNQWYYNYDKETKKLLNELFGSLAVNVVDDSNVFTAENGEAFVVSVALPGVSREDIKISAKNGVLAVSCNPKEGNRFTKKFNRSWDSKGLDVDSLTAAYVDGVLTVKVPKVKKPESVEKTFVVS